jgi:hypothetical protein
VWSRLEAEVSVLEFLGRIGGAGIDEEVVSLSAWIFTSSIRIFFTN